MRSMRWSGVVSVLVVVLLVASSAALAQDTKTVTASTLNVRSGPSTGAAIVGGIPHGQSYVVVGSSGAWRKIWWKEGTAWVHGDYLTGSSAAKVQVTASALNVRTGPGTGYGVVGTAPDGSWWAVVGTSGAWKQIDYGGAARWVHGAYLSTGGGGGGGSGGGGGGGGSASTGGLPSSSAGFVQLPASGTGFYCYSVPERRWGVPAMIYNFMTAASSWKSAHPSWPRIGVGDVSLKYGGPISGHVSHQVGKDADLRLVRTSGEAGVTIYDSAYSQFRTKDLITDHIKAKLDVKVIFFNDPAVYGHLWYVEYWPNHHNHMHVRIH